VSQVRRKRTLLSNAPSPTEFAERCLHLTHSGRRNFLSGKRGWPRRGGFAVHLAVTNPSKGAAACGLRRGTVRCRRRAGTHDRRRCQSESGPGARAGIGPSERYLCTRVYSVRATAEIAARGLAVDWRVDRASWRRLDISLNS
jgi:hypothetical protein